jgi:hypothetical protein
MTIDRPIGGPPAGAALALGLAVLAAAAGALFPPRAGADVAPSPGPAELPAVRRVLLSRDQVPSALDKMRQGVLRMLPRAEFDEKVARAARATDAQRHLPKLAEARYRARLADTALVGTGQWKVVHPGVGAGLLPLQPLNLALRQPRFENRDALIADFDGKAPSLLLESPGDHTVAIEWSARAEERPEGLHFDLKMPVCPVAVLELDLPSDRIAASVDGSLVSGPDPAEAPDRRLWRVGCGGRAGVDLWIRRAGQTAPSTLLLARQLTTQILDPEGLRATYQFDLEVLHREVSELLLEYDSELRPYEVVLPGLDGWEVLPPEKPDGLARLAVHLREPLRQGHGTLLVQCLAPIGRPRLPISLAAPGAPGAQPLQWHSPGMHLAGAVSRGETLVILINPDLRLDGLEPRDFRLVGSAAEPASERRGLKQRLTFAGGAIAGPDGPQRRPEARLQPFAVEYRARQLAWWQPAADPPSLTLQIACEVERGRLFQLPVLLPAGWDVERVEMTPAGLLRNWTVRPMPSDTLAADTVDGTEGRLALLVDLQRPLTPATRERGEGPLADVSLLFGRARVPNLTVHLVPKVAPHGPGEELTFPDAAPLGARFREGMLAIGFDPQTYQATLKASVAEAELEDERVDEGPWGRQVPDAVYQYRGQPVEGTLLLRPRPPLVRARCVSDVYLPAGRAAVNTRLFLEAESGRPDAVDLSISAPSAAATGVARTANEQGHNGWEWRVEQGDNAVKSFERSHAAEAAEVLGALGCGHPFGVAALLAARPPGERWRLTLAKPLRPRSPLVLHAARRLEPINRRWDVPLPVVPGARRMDGEVTLHLAGAEFVMVETAGLQEAPSAPPAPGRSRVGTPWRTFRYGDGSVSLILRGRGALVDRAAEAVADHARLTTYLQNDGAARHHFTFRVSNWTQGMLPLRLPSGARPVAVRIGGHTVALPAGTGLPAEPGVLELPVPRPSGGGAAEGPLRFEVVYDTEAPPASVWKPWATIEAPAPVLPVPALTFRRTWRLPPGIEPIPDGRQRNLPGAGAAARDGLPRALTERFLLDTPLSETLAPHPAAGGQAEGVIAAAVGLRPKSGGRVVRLRELVAELASEFLNGQLVVDDAALREAGIGSESLLGVEPPRDAGDRTPPWEAIGLTVLGTGPVSLLTSADRARQWGNGNRPPDAVRAAVAEALMNGHDASGHYRTTSDWIRHAAETGREGAGETLPDLGPALAPWTEWEPLAGVADDATLTIVRRNHVLVGGILLSAILVPGLWISRRRHLFSGAFVGIAGMAYIWLPSALQPLAWLPLLAGSLAALIGYLLVAVRRSMRGQAAISSPARALVTATALLMTLATAVTTGIAQEPAPATVYIVPDASGASNRETVLASPELLDRLDALARTGPAGSVPVLLAASYEGKVSGKVAGFESVFEAYSPAEGPAPLTLTLDGVYLDGDVLVDGARALPVTPALAQSGFSVLLRGVGRHKVELRFRVPVTELGDGRAIRFGAPRATQSRLRLALPSGASAAQALVKHGSERLTTEAGAIVLEAELGRVTAPLNFRWTQDARAGNVEVREAYLWELTADRATLTGWLDYRVNVGSVSSLAVDLPPGLEVQAAEVRRVGQGDTVRLRDWRISGTGATRLLELDLASPAEGAFQIGLTLVPTVPLATEVTLPLPTPRGRVSAERSHLAYRALGLSVAVENTRWLTGGPPDAFAPFWPEASRPDLRGTRSGIATYAATFRREGGQAPVLRVRLAPAPPRLRVQRHEVGVHVFVRHAEVQATLRLAALDAEPAALTCRLRPATMTVSAVRGEGVRRWTQSGDRLTIWPESGAPVERRAGFSLEITGWLPFDAEGMRLAVPSVQVEEATEAATTSVRLVPEAGLALIPAGLTGLRSVPAPESELAFVAERPDYSGTCEVRAGAGGTAARVLTLAEVRERRLAFRSTVEFSVPRGDLRAATVRLRNWEGEDVKLEVEKAVPLRQRERRRTASDRTWALELRPGVSGRFRLTLLGSVPLEEAAAGVPMPEVTVPGAGATEVLVGVVGPDLSTEVADGLLPVESLAAALKDWPGEADRLRVSGGQLWKVARDDWTLRLRPRGGAESGPVRVLLADHTAAVADGRHWLHEAVYWVRHGANTDLNVLLPKPGTVVAVSVDGVDVAPLQPERRRLWLPLPGRAGVRAVRVRWRYDDQADSLEHPLLETPMVEGAIDGPALWTVFVPAGFEAVSAGASAPRVGPARAAMAALYRAEAQMRVSEALAEPAREGVTAPLASAQQRFYASCRQAEQALQLAGDDIAETGPNGESLARWHRELLDENRRLARDQAFEETRGEAERRSDAAGAVPRSVPEEGEPAVLTGLGPARVRGPLPDAGTPAYFASPESTAAPSLSIRPQQERLWRAALAKSALWLGLLTCAGAVALLPRLKAWLLPFWPEPLLLLGALVWYRSGMTMAAALFLLPGASGRLLTLADGVRSYFRPRRAARTAPSASGVRGSGA